MNDQTPCTYWAEMLAISHPEEDLSPSEYAALEKHVAQCSSCTTVRERYQLMAARVRVLPDVKPLSSFSLEFLHPQKEQYKGAVHSNLVVNSEDIQMSCNQVEELFNAHPDNSLPPEEWREVAAHLQSCTKCSAMLAEFSDYEALFSHFPPVRPDPALRDRIFSSPEFLEPSGTDEITWEAQQNWTVLKPPTRSARRDTSERPLLIGVPRGRSTEPKRSIPYSISFASRMFNTVATLLVIGIIISGFWSLYYIKHTFRGTVTGASSTVISVMNAPTQTIARVAGNPAFIRIIDSSPFVGAADVFVDGAKLLSSFQFGVVTDYVAVPAGPHKVQIALVGKGIGASVISGTLAVSPGVVYTLAATGATPSSLALQVFIDNNLLSPGTAKLRVYQLSPNISPVVVNTSNSILFNDLSFGSASDYHGVDAGNYSFQLDINRSNVVKTESIALNANTVTSIFLVGFFGGSPSLQISSKQIAALPGMPSP